MFTESMIRLFAIVLERDGKKVTETLLHNGVIQFISINSVDASTMSSFQDNSISSTEAITRLQDTRKRIESFLSLISVTPHIPQSIENIPASKNTIKEENIQLDALADELQKIRDQQRLIQNEILKYEEIQRQIEYFGPTFPSDALKKRYTHISMRFGSLPSGGSVRVQKSLQETPAVIVPVAEKDDQEQVIVISMKRDSDRIDTLLSENGWIAIELSSTAYGLKNEVIDAVEKKLQSLSVKQRRLQDESKSVITNKCDSLVESWVGLRIEELYMNVQSTFRYSTKAILFSGWLPQSQRSVVDRLLHDATNGTCHIEWFSPDEVSDLYEEKSAAPVKLRNPRFLAPFQLLVTNFGMPEYGTIDPTPFVVISYLIMFGLMFADIGQGVIVALLGAFGTVLLKKKQHKALASLLIWCGCSSVLFGALFGSFFGFSITKPLWFDFHGIVTGHAHPSSGVSSIYDILGITVKFGIGVISCGLLFNWINLIKKHLWSDLLFDKGGLLGGWMYGGGIYCAWYMVTHNYRELPGGIVIILLLLLPALLLILKEPVHMIQHRTAFSFTHLFSVTMEWVVELLEIFSGYLANTLSFMRVAGLGIAHVSLMVSFFAMADMVRGDNPGIVATIMAILLLIVGNGMVIALEGLSAGIQALRLNYYEFFTKFFHHTGKSFHPISFKE